MIRPFCAALALALATAAAAHSPTQPTVHGGRLTPVDVFWQPTVAGKALPLPDVETGGLPHRFDSQLGRPTFFWAPVETEVPQARLLSDAREARIALARNYLGRFADTLSLTEAQIASAAVREASRLSRGLQVVRFEQRHLGRPVLNRGLSVLMDAQDRLIAISGYFADVPEGAAASPVLSAAQALSQVLEWVGGTLAPESLRALSSEAGYEQYVALEAPSGWRFTRAPRLQALWVPTADGRLRPGFYIELIGAPERGEREDAYGLVVAADDGALLFLKDLVSHQAADAFSYRVWADADGHFTPFDSPLGNEYQPFPGSTPQKLPRVSAPQNLVTLRHGPISTGDPWLPAGATVPRGNNTHAYLDTGFPDGYLPPIGLLPDALLPQDFPTETTAPNTFDYAIEADADPRTETARHAAVVHLFYINNWLHDWFYDSGLTEEAGNAQQDNYGRGGRGGDPIDAQGQDYSGRNNANMLTPADGSSPRMQMYLFDGEIIGEVAVTAPAGLGEPMTFGVASFGPDVYDVIGEVVLAEDRWEEPADGCGPTLPLVGDLGLISPPTPALPQLSLLGKIALIDRGNCSFTSKVAFAQLSGAIGMVVVNNGEGDPIAMGNADLPLPLPIPELSTDALYRVPSVMIRQDDGQRIKDLLLAGQPVEMRLRRDETLSYDGTLDTQVIIHEFFHYVSNRLVGNARGLSNNQGRSMGEGWSDFASLLVTVREEDRQVPGNDRYQGVYVTGHYVTDSAYFGIRRAPYSTDFARNPLTFRHVADGVPLPDTAPLAFGNDGATNAAVHNSGEIWANALWGCYANLLNDPETSFAEAQSRMKDYLITGLKLTPNAPTFLEARDAVLAAARAHSERDFALCSQGFARRGWGLHAVAPERTSSTHEGVVEDYTLFAPLVDLDAGGVPDAGSCAEGAIGCDGATLQGSGAMPPAMLLVLLSAGLWLKRRRVRVE